MIKLKNYQEESIKILRTFLESCRFEGVNEAYNKIQTKRCGNANLCSIIPNLQLKLGLNCIPQENLSTLTYVARFVSEVANMPFNDKAPYVGNDAFSHKGGMHIDAVNKNPISYVTTNNVL